MLKIFCQLLAIFLFSAALQVSAVLQAQAADPPVGTSDGPITITADHMTADDNSRIVTFTGRVIARQDDLIITCDLMRVHYQDTGPAAASSSSPPAEPAASEQEAELAQASPDPQEAQAGPLDGNQEIYRVDCEGSVKIQQGDKLAVGDKAVYLAKSEPRRLILTGQARIWEGKNSVTGHQVVYYLDQNRSQVESQENQRVRAFYDNSDSGADN
jgi:lipopolysaccharide export system protein LptA